ncbi:holo-ACP synthase [Thermoflavimicrobium dichotomicum]|uniref:Holo-[acyl-carrier-protein] synthase n=1 Tax=Thermoflavimicrobium dichotomicum TaxID=46223 RepID=A0A1I3TVQ3_9BACL|nr:holo-ACP synthase [Thermoflavimicrobium dichotomicum]SFJ73651.1 holo-[acyl-carrier protein] synthase [Thermoflavimicrobium dichotomicum]
MIWGIGTDIIEMERIEKAGLDRLAARVLTESEKQMMPMAPKRKLEFLAGRFAAKEAISKALGTGIGEIVSFQDIRIINNENGAPKAQISAETMQCLFSDKKVNIHLSISHSEKYALATAVVEEI